MMNTLAGMGLAGSAVLALWLLVQRLLGSRMPARWHYRVLKISLFFFLIPVGQLPPLAGRALRTLKPVHTAVSGPVPVPAVPQIPVSVLPQVPAASPAVPVPSPAPVSPPEPFGLTPEALRVLAAMWALGAAAMLAYKAVVWLRLRRRVFRWNRPVSSQEARLVFWSCKRRIGVRGPLALWENPQVRSPLAAGLLRPMVVIPAAELDRQELGYLFSHELTHIKCRDLWVRFFAVLAQVLHWYNPLAYVLSRSIQTVSEQSCDERVAGPLSREERYAYGNMILKLASGAAGSGDWAASLSTRECIERRLIRVLRTEKLQGCRRLAALALALAILACGGGAALAARDPLPVSKEAREPARTVTALPAETPVKSGGENAPAAAVPTSGTFPAPTETQVLAAREKALEGMTEKQIERLKLVVREANYEWEFDYLYRNVFAVLEDPDALYWNCFDQKGEIQIAWAVDGDIDMDAVCADEGLTEDEFYAKYGTPVVSDNQYDTNDFTAILDELIAAVRNEDLKAALRYVRDEARLAADQHAVKHANNEYRALHDLDYFLLRYGPSDVGPYVKDDSTITKYYGTLGAFYGAPVPAESEAAGDGEAAGKPVTTNGTPSEAFLKELREHFGVPADTPVLFGDHALIVSRGGTLLPDEDFDSYTCVSGGSDSLSPVIYKEFYTKNSGFDPLVNAHVNVCLSEYDVGRPEALEECNQFISSTLYNLVNGEYPKNSKGESYGHDGFSDYVGYYPDLHAAHGTKGELGYIYNPDEAALPHNLPKDKCPHSFLVPLYDKEHKEIGKFEMSCGGHMMEDVISRGLSLEEAKAALASGEISYSAPTYDDPSANTLEMIRTEAASQWTQAAITDSTPILFGDRDLILRHGGTLLPDNDLRSYTCIDNVIYKCFLDKNGDHRDEYKVGNKDLLSFPSQLKELTADGDYPKNSKGESYGSDALQWYVGYAPDLSYLAEYLPERRPAGYVRESECHVPEHTAQECQREYPIPLYNPEGEVIGQYLLDCGGQHIDTTGMSVEDVKAALAAGATTTGEVKAAAAQARADGQNTAGSWRQQEEVRGDLDLIRGRGGTLLPDGDGISYLIYTGDDQHVYRRYRDRDGVLRREDRVGNKDLLPEEARALLNTLVKGEYPKNARGETYGYESLADYVGYAPDLAVWVEGPEQGYWRQKEMEDKADALHFACKCPGEFRIPLYASDGKTVKTHVTYICPYSVHLE